MKKEEGKKHLRRDSNPQSSAFRYPPGTPIRRPTPYPLGHGGGLVAYIKKFIFQSGLKTIATKGAATKTFDDLVIFDISTKW